MHGPDLLYLLAATELRTGTKKTMGNAITDSSSNLINEHVKTYHHSQQYLSQPRPIRIIVIGAGISGIAAAKLFQEKFDGLPAELVIYEKNDDVTGTWLEV